MPHGEVTWALPSGRKAGTPLADGISPYTGYDKNGPTSILRSVCKLDVTKVACGNLLNMKFSPALPLAGGQDRRLSPKRAQRQARQATRPTGTGTRAQQAIQLQREQQKTQRKEVTREQRQAEQARRYDLRQQKRREKRRGH